MLLERRDLDVVRREKGRLRSYLLVSLKNFLAKARRRELTTKRGEGKRWFHCMNCSLASVPIWNLPTISLPFGFRQIHLVDLSMKSAAGDANR